MRGHQDVYKRQEMDNENLKQTMEVTKLMQEISNIVRYYFSVEFNTESVYYYRFITHLKFFAQRLLTDKEYEDDQDNELFNTIRQKYRTSYKCVEKIAEFISRKYEKMCIRDSPITVSSKMLPQRQC